MAVRKNDPDENGGIESRSKASVLIIAAVFTGLGLLTTQITTMVVTIGNSRKSDEIHGVVNQRHEEALQEIKDLKGLLRELAPMLAAERERSKVTPVIEDPKK